MGRGLLYKSMPMTMIRCARWMIAALAAGLLAPSQAQNVPLTAETLAARSSGLERHDGFLPYYWDGKKGMLLLELGQGRLERQFLYFTGLGSGIGSIKVFADRSTTATSAVCRFRRVGSKVLVMAENLSFRAEHGSPELKRSVESSFPTSVLAALPIEAEQDGNLLVNANPLLIRDATDLLSQLRRPTQAMNGRMVRTPSADSIWRLDESRSVIDLEHTGSFPLNTEVEALLTFSNEEEVNLNQPDRHALSVREHHSFLALPPPGYKPREMDPRVGYFGESFLDFSQPFDRPLQRRFIERWRLEKKDANSAVSEPVKPLVFYLDRAAPEPMRSALRRGALWWNRAFEQAGFKDALRIEDLPEGADPLDTRYPTIQWTNRSGRGWSVGMAQADPRTGEILHAVVQLDSHRMRTVNSYWESTMPPARGNEEPALDWFAALDSIDPALTSEQVMLNRLALLTCHEMGHVLGLEHNFVASTFGRGSVMDYYAPRVKIRPDGSADLSDAYMQGTGSYDNFAIEWGYSEGVPGASEEQEQSRLDSMVRKAQAQGVVWGSDQDPRWNAYDDGPDPVTWLKELWPVRDALLAAYGPSQLRPGEPASVLASRFPLIYLFHRYALSAAVNVVGSARIPPSLVGDGQEAVSVWPAASQRQALELVVKALDPNELVVSSQVWKLLAPPEPGESDPERFSSSAGYLFSPEDGGRAVSEIVVGGLLDRQRMQRLVTLAHQSSGSPGAMEVVSDLVRAAFSRPGSEPAASSQAGLAGVVQTEVAERLMLLSVDDAATSEVQAAALAGVYDVQKIVHGEQSPVARRLDHEISLFLSNPQQNLPRLKPSGAPPGPPV